MGEGLTAEVEHLLAMGYSTELKSMQSIGYRHVADFIEGRLEWDQALEAMKRDTRRYAKRQLTWFRNDAEMIWFHPEQVEHIAEKIEEFVTTEGACI